MGGVQQRKGFVAGGGDGIDQIKYFTTHFRRCVRRGEVGPNLETEGQQKKSVVQFCATENPAHAFRQLNMDFRMCISFPEISGFIIDKGVLEFGEKKGNTGREVEGSVIS